MTSLTGDQVETPVLGEVESLGSIQIPSASEKSTYSTVSVALGCTKTLCSDRKIKWGITNTNFDRLMSRLTDQDTKNEHLIMLLLVSIKAIHKHLSQVQSNN